MKENIRALLSSALLVLLIPACAPPAASPSHPGAQTKIQGGRSSAPLDAAPAPLTEKTQKTRNKRIAAPPQTRANVVWIVLDACRAHNLSCYGYERETSPHIDALAQDGALFEHMYATALETRPSVSSYMTGRYFPFYYLTVKPGISLEYLAPRPTEMLAPTIFADNGYATVVFSAHGGYLQNHAALVQAFDEAHVLAPAKTAQTSTDEAYADFGALNAAVAEWLGKRPPQPFFMYLHAMDTHFPHVYRPEFHSKWLPSGEEPTGIRNGQPVAPPGTDYTFSEEDIVYLQGLYDGSLAYTDHQVGKLVQALKNAGVYENTLCIVTADHGELLAEDGRIWGHGGVHYPGGPVLGTSCLRRVPFIIRGPGISANQRIHQLAELTDLLPTLVDWLKLRTEAEFDGKNLASLILDPAAPPIHAYAVTRARNIDHEPPVLFVDDNKFVFQYDAKTGAQWLWETPHSTASLKNVLDHKPDEAVTRKTYVEKHLLPLWQKSAASGRSHMYTLHYTAATLSPSDAVHPVGKEASQGTDGRAVWQFRYSNLFKEGPGLDLPPVDFRISLPMPPADYAVLIEWWHAPHHGFQIKSRPDAPLTTLAGGFEGSTKEGFGFTNIGLAPLENGVHLAIDDLPGRDASMRRIRLISADYVHLLPDIEKPQEKAAELPETSETEIQDHQERLEALGYL